MCYDVASKAQADLRYAVLRGASEKLIYELTKKQEELRGKPIYHASGFAHPQLLVFTNDKPYEPQLFTWGLIPAWVQDADTASAIQNQTLNARGETIFDKPSFRNAAQKKRCLIYLDAFYEHHHYKGKTYPFRISMKSGEPFAVAGLWEEWVDKESGEIKNTVTIVTTEANDLMAKIHNNPKAEGGRMPVILPKDKQDEWLVPINNNEDKQRITDLIQPFDSQLMSAYTVGRLKGKAAKGNVPEVGEEIKYPELSF